ncbi:MAG: DUF1491 family protein [Roseiarcus sp.]
MQLRADIWVAAYLRRAGVEGAFATLRRRGAAEAGAIFVVVDRLDGRAALYEPAPSVDGERRFLRAHADEWISPADVEARLQRQLRFDPDMWIVDLESRDGTHWLDLA